MTGRRARPPAVADVGRDAQRADLLAQLVAWAGRGQVAPCATWPDAGWTDDDRAQEAAAGLCGGCPALTACRAYGAAWPDETGVYGARTDLDRRPRVGRPKLKETAA